MTRMRVPGLTTERIADGAGVVTVVIGVALTAAPARTARLLGIGNRPALARTLGVADLVVGPGLLLSTRRWPWMAARAALNLLVAAVFRSEARRTAGRSRAWGGQVAMTMLTVVDGAAAMALRAATRGGRR